jgi:hypothetical protein
MFKKGIEGRIECNSARKRRRAARSFSRGKRVYSKSASRVNGIKIKKRSRKNTVAFLFYKNAQSRRCGLPFGLQLFNFYVAAKDVGIGIGGFAKEVLVVGFHGKKGGIHPRKHPEIAHAFIPAEIDFHGNPFFCATSHHLFDIGNFLSRLNHSAIIAKKKEKYTSIKENNKGKISK